MKVTADQIDALLPQTQCGECGFAGCKPYARAIANGNAKINLCPPGGKTTLKKLAELTAQNAKEYLENFIEKPIEKAVIDPYRCIGCLKCIKACPVDAIVGAQQRLHTVIEADCTGCTLCIAPCPVDCIEMVKSHVAHNPQKAKIRYLAKQKREALREAIEHTTYQTHTTKDKRAEIAAAVARFNQKQK